MTAAEIRDLTTKLVRHNPPDHEAQIELLGELAAQLAEINDRFRLADDQLHQQLLETNKHLAAIARHPRW